MANKDIIEHKGVISRIEGKTAFVTILQESACAGCHVKQMCSVSESKEKIIEAKMLSDGFNIGDEVIVIGQKNLAFKAVLLAYVLPFGLVLAALFIFNLFINSEIIVGSLALFVLVPYFLIMRLFNTRFQGKFQFYVSKN